MVTYNLLFKGFHRIFCHRIAANVYNDKAGISPVEKLLMYVIVTSEYYSVLLSNSQGEKRIIMNILLSKVQAFTAYSL